MERNMMDVSPRRRGLSEVRSSLLTDLFRTNPHIATVHHTFAAILICLMVNTGINNYVLHKKFDLELDFIYSSFGKMYKVFSIWSFSMMVACWTYYIFKAWANALLMRGPNDPSWLLRFVSKIYNKLWMIFLFLCYAKILDMTAYYVRLFELPPASASIVLIEQVRILMKMHAFIRTNADRVLDGDEGVLLELRLSKFIYFLFAPTFNYRNQYPRTKEIRWWFVFYRFLEILGVIYFQSILFQRHIVPPFKDFGLRKFTRREIVIAIFQNSIPGLLVKVSGFYLLLHSVQNLFAEVLRFGDRMFYMDWWTSTSFSDYFRTWNILVHDWLFTFVYKDVHSATGGNKTLAKAAVFLISALVHEYILINMFGFFFPALFFLFLFGATALSCFRVPRTPFLNILFWYALTIGSGILVSVYTLEYFARQNVSVTYEKGSWRDYIMPKCLTCTYCMKN